MRDVLGIVISLGLFGFLAYVAYTSGNAEFSDRSRGILNFLEMITNGVVNRFGQINAALIFLGTGVLFAAYYVVRMMRR